MDTFGTERKLICASDALLDNGSGVRFSVHTGGSTVPAFVVRYRGAVHAYVNRCTHRGVELDWEQGRFFDFRGRWLICSTHGALYDPTDGACIGGPCPKGLSSLPIAEDDGQVWLLTTNELDLA
jgi:nitrite reductase/ring-hydroxylating ferredoxin subunit